MSELGIIQATLRRAARRRRLDRGLRGLWIGLLAGTAAWLLGLALHRIAPIPDAIPELGWLAALAAAVVGFVAGLWRPVPLAAAARIVESRHRLDQRLSTALELASPDRTAQAPSTWVQLVVADAHKAIQGLDVAKLLPLRLPSLARWIPVVLVAVVGLGFVPPYRSTAYLQKQRDAVAIRETGRKVAELIRKELEKPEGSEPIREALEHAGDLGERLSQAKLTKAEALKDLASAAERLKEEARQLDASPALQKLQQAARSPSGATGAGAANPALQKQLEKLQQSVGNNTPEAMDQLARQLEQARQMAAGMQGGPQDAGAQQALAQALQQLAENAAHMGLDLASLNQALDAMKDLNLDRVLRDLKMAGQDLDKLRDMAKKLAEMQQNMQQLGKDLAEQLDRGQAETAAQTLDKMVEQLQTAGLTPEQTKQMLAEVSKALEPAGQYGQVENLLKAAATKLAEGSKTDAAKNLGEAAQALRQMAKEAQDMQMLADALEALQEAQLAIASGRAWQPGGMCKGGACAGCALHPNGRPRVGKGGKPGRGVGTWADENGFMYLPEISERWDNTGLDRPDMTPRGHTDRGDGQLADTIAPTKLQGQFTPGPMPSITLKGVNIKGQSSVKYEQAVEAAQSEAQSALNQDQVPRAYRGAVKGYFDDLK